MEVTKRNGVREGVDFNKITNRLKTIANKIENNKIDVIKIAQKVCSAIYHGVSTQELDELSAEISISLSTEHIDYGVLASHITISNMHKTTKDKFMDIINIMKEENTITKELYETVKLNSSLIEDKIDYERDYNLEYFGIKTLQKSYLLKKGNNVIERPQHMWMRTALGIHGNNLNDAFETYDLMSQKYFTHATPTLFNAGKKKGQMSSCYLISMNDDSIKGIYKTLGDCAQISKYAGGIGLHIHNLRASGGNIGDVENACTGIVPALRVYNATARYVNQGGRRPGSIAIYLSVDHPDVLKFLELKKNHGDEEERCRDLFYAMWIPDLFMKRVKENKKWSLFCPHKTEDLSNYYGEEYERKYIEYEEKQMYNEQIDAQKLWFKICESQIETGTPYILYKDSCNIKSNQKNIGVIKSSNLCSEIIQYSSPTETAVCNLASIALPQFISNGNFNFDYLHNVTKVVTRNLNKVIDKNFYPIPESYTSNMKHRPIGIGVQGLADVFMIMKYPFDSKKAKQLNMDIFETMYHASLEASMELSKVYGPYESYEGSPMSQGMFQFDLWNRDYTKESSRFDWDCLRDKIKTHGIRNSLLISLMPTASTSQILGNNECIEPITSNIYLRRTLAGEFLVINKYLMKDLHELGIWNENVKNQIIRDEGSVKNLNISDEMKQIYKTVWEIKQKDVIDQSSDRGIFVCQSQSLNIFIPRPTTKILSSAHFYGWDKGLKTGMYYLRTKPASNPIQFTLPPTESMCESCSG